MVALVVAAWELRASARTAGQAYAREAWAKYLELGFHHPIYGSTEAVLEKLDLIKFNLRLHREAIRLTWPTESAFYSNRLYCMMREVLNEPEE